MKNLSPVGLALVLLLAGPTLAFATPKNPISISAKKVFENDEILWGFDFVSESEVLASYKDGRIFHFNFKTQASRWLASPKIKKKGQGGLLDLKILKIDQKRWVYVTFSETHKGVITTSLARALWSPLKNLKFNTLFRAKVNSSKGQHFGSRLQKVGPYLFMSIGDRGSRETAQDLTLHSGKILRLTLEGKPAPENPFVERGGLPEIWSLGHRNPQGLFWDEVRKKLFSCEFGPRGGDELNIVEAGKNYGWPEITYGKEYWGPTIGQKSKPGMEQPIVYWVPSISPSGMMVYRGSRYKEWNGHILMAGLGSRHLRRLVLQDNLVTHQESLLSELDERIRMVRQGPDSHIYFSTDSGRLYRLVRAQKAQPSI